MSVYSKCCKLRTHTLSLRSVGVGVCACYYYLQYFGGKNVPADPSVDDDASSAATVAPNAHKFCSADQLPSPLDELFDAFDIPFS